MKKLFLAIIFAAAALAADPVVVVNSASSVSINGVPAGTVVDALANNPNVSGLRARLLDAWLAYEKGIAASADKRAQDAANEAHAIKEKEIAAASADAEKAKADAEQRIQVAEQTARAARTAADERCAATDAEAKRLVAEVIAKHDALVAAVRAATWNGVDPTLRKAVDAAARTEAEMRAARKAQLEAEIRKLTAQ